MEDAKQGDQKQHLTGATRPRPLNRRRFIAVAGGGAASLLWMAGCGGGSKGGGGGGGSDTSRVVVRPETVVLPSDASTLVSPLAGDFSLLRVRGNVAPTITAGSVLVSGAGEGLLRKVTGVTARDADSVVVTTEPAALTDVFEKGKFDFEYPITFSDIQNVSGGMDGIIVSPVESRAETAAALTLKLAGTFRLGSYVEGQGEIELGPTLRLKADFDLRQFEMTLGVSSRANVALNVRSGFESGDITLQRWKIRSLILKRIPFFIGVVPFVIVATLDLYSTLSGSLELGVRFDFGGEASARAGFSYSPGNGIRPVTDWSGAFSLQPNTKTYASFAAEMEVVRPELNFRLNAIAGPFIGLALPRVEVEAERTALAAPEEGRRTVYRGSLVAEASVGAKLEVFDRAIASGEFTAALGPGVEINREFADDGQAEVNIN